MRWGSFLCIPLGQLSPTSRRALRYRPIFGWDDQGERKVWIVKLGSFVRMREEGETRMSGNCEVAKRKELSVGRSNVL